MAGSLYNPDEIGQAFFGAGTRGRRGFGSTAQEDEEYTGGIQAQAGNIPARTTIFGDPAGFTAGQTPRPGTRAGIRQGLGPGWARVLGYDPTNPEDIARRSFGSALAGRRFAGELPIRTFGSERGNPRPPRQLYPPMGDPAAVAKALGDVLARAALMKPDIDPRTGLPIDQRQLMKPGRYAEPTPGPTPEIINILADMAQRPGVIDEDERRPPGSVVGDVTKIGRA